MSFVSRPSSSVTAGGPSGRGLAGLRWLALATTAATYALVVLGSTVRVTESGMGCPGWPLCYGSLGPIDRFHALLEQSHRYLAALVTVLVLATAVAALRRRGSPTVRPALAGVAVIVVQVLLGAITVFTHNAPWTVAGHLLTGLVLLTLVTMTAVAAFAPRRQARGRRLAPLGWWAGGGVLLLLVSGSLVVDGGASGSCPSWPGCPTAGIPAGLVILQLAHRGVAGLVGLALLALAGHAWQRWSAVPGARATALILAVLLSLAGLFGAVTGVLCAPAVWQDLHLAAAAAVLVAAVALDTLGWLSAADGRADQAPSPDREPPDASGSDRRSGGTGDLAERPSRTP